MKITITKCTSETNLSKKYQLNTEGKLIKTASANMYAGQAQKIELSFNKFYKVLDNSDSRTAFIYGSCDFDDIKIVKNGDEKPGSISRTQKYFKYQKSPGILMLDHDPSQYGTSYKPGELIEILTKIHPEIADCAYIHRASVSAGVLVNGQPNKSKGFHIYIPVKDASDIPRYGKQLFKTLWINGYGYIALSKCGSMLVRSPIDEAVFSPERLDFVGMPILDGEGLSYKSPASMLRPGGLLDTTTLPTQDNEIFDNLVKESKRKMTPEVTKQQNSWVAEKVKAGVSEYTARQVLKGGSTDLYGDFVLEFANGPVTVKQVLESMQQYDRMALADPVEGVEYGKSTAIFYANDGKPIINSLAHGTKTQYFLHMDKIAEQIDGIMKNADITVPEINKNQKFHSLDLPLTYLTPPHTNEKGKVLSTDKNLEFVFEKYGITCYYDEILKESFINFQRGDEYFNDISENGKLQVLKSLLALNEYPKETIDRIPAILMKNTVNPILQFIESKHWDGVSRLQNIFDSVTVQECDKKYRDKAMRMWLIQCIAAADGAKRTPIYGALNKFECVLIFQGEQGMKKTTWIQSLLPKNYIAYIKDGVMLDCSDKDSKKEAISAWIVELGELDGTFRKSDISRLKSFLSDKFDSMRMPYDKLFSKFQRRTSFFASVNESRFLVDETGNRRFIPIKVQKNNPLHGVDTQQLWAECMHLYLAGETWWPDDELDMMMRIRHGEHLKIDNIEDTLRTYFEIDSPPKVGTHMSCTQILKKCGIWQPSKNDTNACSKILKDNGFVPRKSGVLGYVMVLRDEQIPDFDSYDSIPHYQPYYD